MLVEIERALPLRDRELSVKFKQELTQGVELLRGEVESIISSFKLSLSDSDDDEARKHQINSQIAECESILSELQHPERWIFSLDELMELGLKSYLEQFATYESRSHEFMNTLNHRLQKLHPTIINKLRELKTRILSINPLDIESISDTLPSSSNRINKLIQRTQGLSPNLTLIPQFKSRLEQAKEILDGSGLNNKWTLKLFEMYAQRILLDKAQQSLSGALRKSTVKSLGTIRTGPDNSPLEIFSGETLSDLASRYQSLIRTNLKKVESRLGGVELWLQFLSLPDLNRSLKALRTLRTGENDQTNNTTPSLMRIPTEMRTNWKEDSLSQLLSSLLDSDFSSILDPVQRLRTYSSYHANLNKALETLLQRYQILFPRLWKYSNPAIRDMVADIALRLSQIEVADIPFSSIKEKLQFLQNRMGETETLERSLKASSAESLNLAAAVRTSIQSLDNGDLNISWTTLEELSTFPKRIKSLIEQTREVYRILSLRKPSRGETAIVLNYISGVNELYSTLKEQFLPELKKLEVRLSKVPNNLTDSDSNSFKTWSLSLEQLYESINSFIKHAGHVAVISPEELFTPPPSIGLHPFVRANPQRIKTYEQLLLFQKTLIEDRQSLNGITSPLSVRMIQTGLNSLSQVSPYDLASIPTSLLGETSITEALTHFLTILTESGRTKGDLLSGLVFHLLTEPSAFDQEVLSLLPPEIAREISVDLNRSSNLSPVQNLELALYSFPPELTSHLSDPEIQKVLRRYSLSEPSSGLALNAADIKDTSSKRDIPTKQKHLRDLILKCDSASNLVLVLKLYSFLLNLSERNEKVFDGLMGLLNNKFFLNNLTNSFIDGRLGLDPEFVEKLGNLFRIHPEVAVALRNILSPVEDWPLITGLLQGSIKITTEQVNQIIREANSWKKLSQEAEEAQRLLKLAQEGKTANSRTFLDALKLIQAKMSLLLKNDDEPNKLPVPFSWIDKSMEGYYIAPQSLLELKEVMQKIVDEGIRYADYSSAGMISKLNFGQFSDLNNKLSLYIGSRGEISTGAYNELMTFIGQIVNEEDFGLNSLKRLTEELGTFINPTNLLGLAGKLKNISRNIASDWNGNPIPVWCLTEIIELYKTEAANHSRINELNSLIEGLSLPSNPEQMRDLVTSLYRIQRILTALSLNPNINESQLSAQIAPSRYKDYVVHLKRYFSDPRVEVMLADKNLQRIVNNYNSLSQLGLLSVDSTLSVEVQYKIETLYRPLIEMYNLLRSVQENGASAMGSYSVESATNQVGLLHSRFQNLLRSALDELNWLENIESRGQGIFATLRKAHNRLSTTLQRYLGISAESVPSTPRELLLALEKLLTDQFGPLSNPNFIFGSGPGIIARTQQNEPKVGYPSLSRDKTTNLPVFIAVTQNNSAKIKQVFNQTTGQSFSLPGDDMALSPILKSGSFVLISRVNNLHYVLARNGGYYSFQLLKNGSINTQTIKDHNNNPVSREALLLNVVDFAARTQFPVGFVGLSPTNFSILPFIFPPLPQSLVLKGGGTSLVGRFLADTAYTNLHQTLEELKTSLIGKREETLGTPLNRVANLEQSLSLSRNLNLDEYIRILQKLETSIKEFSNAFTVSDVSLNAEQLSKLIENKSYIVEEAISQLMRPESVVADAQIVDIINALLTYEQVNYVKELYYATSSDFPNKSEGSQEQEFVNDWLQKFKNLSKDQKMRLLQGFFATLKRDKITNNDIQSLLEIGIKNWSNLPLEDSDAQNPFVGQSSLKTLINQIFTSQRTLFSIQDDIDFSSLTSDDQDGSSAKNTNHSILNSITIEAMEFLAKGRKIFGSSENNRISNWLARLKSILDKNVDSMSPTEKGILLSLITADPNFNIDSIEHWLELIASNMTKPLFREIASNVRNAKKPTENFTLHIHDYSTNTPQRMLISQVLPLLFQRRIENVLKTQEAGLIKRLSQETDDSAKERIVEQKRQALIQSRIPQNMVDAMIQRVLDGNSNVQSSGSDPQETLRQYLRERLQPLKADDSSPGTYTAGLLNLKSNRTQVLSQLGLSLTDTEFDQILSEVAKALNGGQATQVTAQVAQPSQQPTQVAATVVQPSQQEIQTNLASESSNPPTQAIEQVAQSSQQETQTNPPSEPISQATQAPEQAGQHSQQEIQTNLASESSNPPTQAIEQVAQSSQQEIQTNPSGESPNPQTQVAAQVAQHSQEQTQVTAQAGQHSQQIQTNLTSESPEPIAQVDQSPFVYEDEAEKTQGGGQGIQESLGSPPPKGLSADQGVEGPLDFSISPEEVGSISPSSSIQRDESIYGLNPQSTAAITNNPFAFDEEGDFLE
jgi:hypothetical protein